MTCRLISTSDKSIECPLCRLIFFFTVASVSKSDLSKEEPLHQTKEHCQISVHFIRSYHPKNRINIRKKFSVSLFNYTLSYPLASTPLTRLIPPNILLYLPAHSYYAFFFLSLLPSIIPTRIDEQIFNCTLVGYRATLLAPCFPGHSFYYIFLHHGI